MDMQHCERDGEEDEFEGHFLFLFLFFGGRLSRELLREPVVVVGEEEEDLG